MVGWREWCGKGVGVMGSDGGGVRGRRGWWEGVWGVWMECEGYALTHMGGMVCVRVCGRVCVPGFPHSQHLRANSSAHSAITQMKTLVDQTVQSTPCEALLPTPQHVTTQRKG